MPPIPSIALPSLIDWPRAERPQRRFPWEIWWFTATLRAGDRAFAAHLLFTLLADGRLNATAALVDMADGTERTRVIRTAPGEATLAADALRIETELCSLAGSYAEGYRLRADLGGGEGFDLALVPTRPVLHNGGAGQFDFQGVPTTQYSVGFLQTSGTVRVAGTALPVTGMAWHDRQWDNAARSNVVAFTWFGICLDGGDTLSFFDTRAGDAQGHSWVTIAQPDGTHIVAAAEAAPVDVRPSAVGRPVAERWTLAIPARQARLELHQRRVVDQPAIYTGLLDVAGSYAGAATGGYGFCDLVGPIG